jgi:hypothetical protein
MAQLTEIVYQGRDNSVDLLLLADGVAVALDAVSRMVLADLGGAWTVDSQLQPTAFDWSTGVTGKLVLELGGAVASITGEAGYAQIPAGRHAVRLIVYDVSHPNGVVWGQIWLKVFD